MNRKLNLANAILSVLIGLTLLFSAVQPVSVSASNVQVEGGVQRSVHPQTGKLSFLGADPTNPLRVERAMERGLAPESRAGANLEMYAREFGIRDVGRELRVMRSSNVDDRLMVKYQQVYNDIPVVAGELIVNMKGNGGLLSINGEVSPDMSLDTQPKLSAEDARQRALALISQTYALAEAELTVSEPELWIFDERLIQDKATQPVHLVWRMEVASENAPLRELVLVNAQTGKISLHFNQVDTSWTGNPLPAREDSIKPNDTTDIEPIVETDSTPITRYVNGASGVDAGGCDSSENPCKNIQYAIMNAIAGDTIAVTGGVYKYVSVPDSGNVETPGQVTPRQVILLSKTVVLSGGWDTTFNSQAGLSVLDAEHGRYGISVSVPVGNVAEIDHFGIKNGTSGIYKFIGELILKNSSIYWNDGIGLWNTQLSMTLENVTVSENAGAGIFNGGTTTITNSTISGNGNFGINRLGGNITIRNTVVSGNGNGNSAYDCNGPIISGDNNIIGNTTNCIISPLPADQFNVDPLLAAFLPSRGYQPLQSESPAEGTANPVYCPALDQRGIERFLGGDTLCDIGAYEYTEPGPAAIVSAETGINQRMRVDGDYAEPLGVSVLDAQGSPVAGADVTFIAPASGPSVVFQGSGISSEGPFTTNTSGIVTTSLMTANSEFGAFTVVADAGSVGIANIPLENLPWKWYVSNTGNDSNSCYVPTEPCATINAAVAKASATDTIYVAEGSYTGTGLAVVTIQKSITLSGGWNNGFTSQTGYSTIDGQNARRGMDISGPLTVNLDHFEVMNGKGSGISSYQAILTVDHSYFHDNNYDGGYGGGIRSSSGKLNISRSTFYNNSARSGGGVYVSGYNSYEALLNYVTISGNHADYGGGIYVNDPGVFTVKNSIVANNTAATEGPDCKTTAQMPSISGGNNIVGTTCGTQQPTDLFNVDPGLGVFLPEQGYIPLRPNSPAVNYSDNTCAEDQRGVAASGVCDAGAFEFITNSGTPTSIWAVSGNDQRTPPNQAFLQPLTAVVLDAEGNPVQGREVSFSAPASGASATFQATGGLSEGPLFTNEVGAVTSSTVIANGIPGGYTITADGGGVGTAEFSMTNAAWYVAPTGNDTSNSCSIAAEPCATINGAITKAISGDTVFVAQDVYTGTGTEVVFTDKAVHLSGGWNANFDTQDGYTIIDGESARQGIVIEKEYVSTPILVIIDHFTVRNGYIGFGLGGGIQNSHEMLQLSDSILEGNYAPTGGGLYNTGASSLNRVIVRNNRAGSGGGIASGGRGPLTIENSAISGNDAETGNGGGIYNESALTMTNVSIIGNDAKVHGGGLHTYAISGDAVVLNNVTVSGNIAGEAGGGIRNERASYLLPLPQVNNSIVAGNTAAVGNDCSAKFVFTYSLVQDTDGCTGATDPTNLFQVDPNLMGFLPTEGYMPLKSSSPAKDKGNPAEPGSGGTSCAVTDQRGASRKNDRCDMGAYEYTTPGSASRIVPLTYGLRTPPNAAFDQPLQATVLDALGSPVLAPLTLRFASPEDGGPSGLFANLSHAEDVALDSNGVATSSIFTANSQLGEYLVTVSSPGITSGNIPLSNFAWYVRTDGNDANSCSSPDLPCLTINNAIAKAKTGDTIYVAEGRYSGATIRITTSVKIIGSWKPDFSARGGATIIDNQKAAIGVANSAFNSLLARIIIENSNGGLSNSSSITLDQVAIINNLGMGIYNDGIYESTMTITNSTISQNQDGGLYSDIGAVTINNSTIAGNGSTLAATTGGGIYNDRTTITISNSIIANNSAATGPDCYNQSPYGGPIISAGNNILGNTTGCTITATSGDKFNVNPQLLPLLPLGYYPLVTASPAIGQGNPATCTNQDQRGVERLLDSKCDIGAYEYRISGPAVGLLAVNPQVRRTAIHEPFRSSLQAVAVDVFGSPVGGVPVNFTAPANGPSGFFLSGGTTESLTTDGNGYATSSVFTANGEYGDYLIVAESEELTDSVAYQLHNGAWLVNPVSGNDANDCLSIATPCRSIDGIILKNSFNSGDTVWVAAGNAGAGLAGAHYIKRDMVFVGGWDPTFTTKGGASKITASYSNAADLTLKNFVLSSVLDNAGRLVLENVSIFTNVKNSYDATLIISNATVSGNGPLDAPISNKGGTIYIFNSTITKNTGRWTGGVYNDPSLDGVVYLKDTILAGNTATLATEKKTNDCLGDFISLGHNIVGTVGIVTGGTNECHVEWMESDIHGDNAHPYSSSLVINTTVKQDPTTGQWYHALKLGGPAIDRGNEALPGSGGNACPATDQLGTVRPQGARCDIGAVEYKFGQYPANYLLVTYTARNGTTLPGTKLCESNTATCTTTDTQAKSVHKYAYSAYNQYKLWHTRNSLDGNGFQIMSTVHYDKSYKNAFWNGYMLVFGDGYGFAMADDVVAHELTHGVTQFESNLFYWYQSGAINESFSDLWGEAVDQTNKLGTDTASVKWLIGEDVTNLGAIRSMSKPPDFGDPDSMTSSLYCESGDCLKDNGGVHTNSGVNNKAVYLMVNGGKFNGRTVTALGWPKTLAIYYQAQTDYLTSGSDYLDLYNALYQSCKTLIGTKGITLATCTEVRDATVAVRMNAQPVANFNLDTPFCPAGTYRAAPDVFFDDFETGMDGWTIGKIKGQSAWSLSSANAASGKASLWADDAYSKTDSYATTQGIKLPAGSKPYLHFTHSYNFEASGTTYYDGGVLEYSLNSGRTWVDAKALFSSGQNYKGVIKTANANPLGGRTAFVGQSHGYVDSRYNLTTLAGRTVLLRWRVGTDAATAVSGWHVDDVRIYYCVSIPSVPGLLAPVNDALLTDLTPTFDWSDSAPDLHHYQLQLATDSAFTENLVNYDTIPTSTFSLSADLNAATTYYWRVRAFNAASKASAWSAYRTIRTVFAAPSGGMVNNGDPLATLTPPFSWDSVQSATSYRIQISADSNFSTWLVDESVDTNLFTPAADLPAGSLLYWRVQVDVGIYAPGEWSTVWSFTTP